MANFINNSSFWLDEDYNYDVLTGETRKPGKDYVKMAATLRAISNFVSIVTGKSIPVTYSTRDESFTDGKQVVIAGNVKDKDFDPTVGLALHEGSHCLLTDFGILKDLMKNCHNDISAIDKDLVIEIADKHFSHIEETNDQVYYSRKYIQDIMKMLLNFVEDRRIDNFIYRSAPGYQGYYKAMYDKYFHSKIVDKGLRSNEKRDLTWDSYFFRIINLTNSNRDLNALPGLIDIWRLLDLRNIGRLICTKDSLNLAFEIFNIVESHIPEPQPIPGKNCKSGNKKQVKGGTGLKNYGNSKKANTPKGKAGKDNGSKAKGSKITSSNGGATKNNLPELSDSQKRQLKKAIEKQLNALAGKIEKSKVTKKDKKNIKACQTSGSEFKNVGDGISKNYYTTGDGTKCLIVKNLTQALADSNMYNTFTSKGYYKQTDISVISDGIRLGTMLGKKLQIRNEENSLKYNRLRKGKIDKRMIASLGFGNEAIFNQVFIDQFNPAIVHISIDASGSMGGPKWKKTQTAAIAIAKAASMVQNLDIVISYRSTEEIGNTYYPAIFIAYDSRKDKINKITSLFKHIGCPGTTPEGLCFEAIQKEIVNGSNGIDSYFINFSDGEPYFENSEIDYYGHAAAAHTKKQVENMRDRGIKVLSYFISSGNGYGCKDKFKTMYGNDAQNVNVTKLNELTKTLNKRFATK